MTVHLTPNALAYIALVPAFLGLVTGFTRMRMTTLALISIASIINAVGIIVGFRTGFQGLEVVPAIVMALLGLAGAFLFVTLATLVRKDVSRGLLRKRRKNASTAQQ